MDISREKVLEAGRDSTSITGIARKQGFLEKKLSGRIAKAIREAAPEITEIIRANRSAAKAKAVKPEEPNPYGRGLYRELYRQGTKAFQLKADLLSSVAMATGKPITSVAYAFAVLASRGGRHSSNNRRSTAVTNDRGMVRLIPLNPKAGHIH